MYRAATSANPATQRVRRYREHKRSGTRSIQSRVSEATVALFARLLEPHARHARASSRAIHDLEPRNLLFQSRGPLKVSL